MTDPLSFSCAETLRNGLTVTIRALRPDDRERIVAAFRQLDRESIYTRFFSYRTELTEPALDRTMRVDPQREAALVVTVGSGDDEVIIGSGRYVASGPPGTERSAEVAFMVEEDYHGLGIAGRLLAHLAISPGARASPPWKPRCSRRTGRCFPSSPAADFRCSSDAMAA